MEISKEISEKIQELQVYEKNLQNYIAEKQSIQVELNGINNALSELKISGDEVYKILDGIMLKTEKNSLIKELNEKKKIFDLRISTVENQEKSTDEKISKLRQEINDSISPKKK